MSAAALRNPPRLDRDTELRDRIVALAHWRCKAGLIYLKLRQKGRTVNHKRVDRLYAEARLQVKRRRRKKVPRAPAAAPGRVAPGEVISPGREHTTAPNGLAPASSQFAVRNGRVERYNRPGVARRQRAGTPLRGHALGRPRRPPGDASVECGPAVNHREPCDSKISRPMPPSAACSPTRWSPSSACSGSAPRLSS